MTILVSELEADYFNAIVGRRHAAQRPRRIAVRFGDGTEPQASECHPNAERWVKENPDHAVVRGWIMESHSEYCTMLAAHSLVRDAHGDLIEITPLRSVHTPFLEHVGSDATFLALLPRFNSIPWPPPTA